VTVIVALVLAALAPGLFTDVSPFEQSLSARLTPPLTDGHLLGTDGLGRDVFARIVHGARATVVVAVSSLVISAGIGTLVGLVSGLFGGWLDAVLMRLTDTVLALPMILFALFLVILFGPSITNVVIAIGVLAWARYARVIRGETLVVRQQDYVAQARISGISRPRIVLRHLLPNVAPAILVLVTLQVGWVVLVEATLSFLGAGVPPPQPSWGGMVADGRQLMTSAWWVAGFPGIAILILVTSLNTLGDRVRDHFDPMLD
jgi:peptide/nickel transport system permease protein